MLTSGDMGSFMGDMKLFGKRDAMTCGVPSR